MDASILPSTVMRAHVGVLDRTACEPRVTFARMCRRYVSSYLQLVMFRFTSNNQREFPGTKGGGGEVFFTFVCDFFSYQDQTVHEEPGGMEAPVRDSDQHRGSGVNSGLPC